MKIFLKFDHASLYNALLCITQNLNLFVDFNKIYLVEFTTDH